MKNRPASAELYEKAIGEELRYQDAYDKADNKQPWAEYPSRPTNIISRHIAAARAEAVRGVNCESCLVGRLGECALLDTEKSIEDIVSEVGTMTPVELAEKQKILTTAVDYSGQDEAAYNEAEQTKVHEYLDSVRRDELKRGVPEEILDDIGLSDIPI